ncbi:MAG: hypothetical protein V3T84_08390 [Phycisphaerales bacterium]
MHTKLNTNKLMKQHPHDNRALLDIEGHARAAYIKARQRGCSEREAEEQEVGEIIFHLLASGIDVKAVDVWADQRIPMNFGGFDHD